MFHTLFSFLAKALWQMVVWVFILSIPLEGRTLFDHIHEVIVDNPVVLLISEETQALWHEVTAEVKKRYAKVPAEADEGAI